ncbi:MAG: pantoate--beta-alanine ligase [Bifidobacteriaceae bacterium]|jgi:pantoate--beta-alanine ligase|nr:pantoate--beta-alanine ligase [Bifidobacteriaceae bacterium]
MGESQVVVGLSVPDGARPAVVHTYRELLPLLRTGPRAVVMTMGALHQGHLDLVAKARELMAPVGGQVVVTVFVNPLQFGPAEDYEAYPRTLPDDVAALTGLGVDLVYAPSVVDMYPAGPPLVRVSPGPLGAVFEGAIRPGHFEGVLTVVLKLLQRTTPTVALFGQKDAQQVAVVHQMVSDLDVGARLVVVPIRREPDGLALSSRNRYLDPAQRQVALALPRAIAAGEAVAAAGGTVMAVRAAAWAEVADRPGLSVDYLEVVDRAEFTPVLDAWTGPALLIGAIRVGSTRLIDNAPIVIQATSGGGPGA